MIIVKYSHIIKIRVDTSSILVVFYNVFVGYAGISLFHWCFVMVS